MKTVVKFSNSDGELGRCELTDEDATTQAIAEAVIGLVTQTGMSMRAGDVIEVTEEES